MNYDEHPSQNATNLRELTGEFPQYSIAGLRECVVVERLYAGADNNRSRIAVEYTCRDMHSGEFYYNCRQVFDSGGIDDGEESVLQPATKTFNASKINPFRAAKDTDGDRVLVGFVNGSHARPVILGVLPHRKRAYGTTAQNGKRRYVQHRDTTFEVKDDGTFVLARHPSGVGTGPKTSITLEPNGDIKVEHANGLSKLSLLDDGTIEIEGRPADGVKLGANAAFHPLYAELFVPLLQGILSAIGTAVGTSGTPPGASASGGAIAAAAQAFIAAVNATCISRKVTLE